MLRASGAMLICAAALFFFGDLAIARSAQLHDLAPAVVFGIGLACFFCPSWLSFRPWRSFLFASYCLLILIYAFSALGTHNLVFFFATLCLLEMGAAALTPWEDFWQAGLNFVCLLAWTITARMIPHSGLELVDMSMALVAAAAIGQLTARIRRQFTADNPPAGHKFRGSETRLRKIMNARPDTVSITRDNQGQHELVESPATLGAIFDASTDSMVVSDFNTGLVIEINREFSRLTGYTRADAVGRDIRELRLWNDHAKAAEFARSLRQTNEVRNVEDLVRTKSGALVPCLMSGALIDFGGRQCCFATTRDVTELKQTQRRLEESEHRFRTIFTAMPGSIAIINSKGVCIDLSQPLATSGYTREDVVGRNMNGLGLWGDPEEKAEIDRVWERDGSVTSMELHIRRKDATSMPTVFSAAPLEIDGERCSIMMAFDITALKEAQRKAVESQATLGKIFDASSDSMMVTDIAHDAVIAVNAEFMRMTGYTREEVVGHSLGEFKLTDGDDETAEILRRLRDTGEVRNMEFAGRRKNGEPVPTLLSMRSVEFDGRQCRLTTARDITVLKDALRKAVESQATLGKIFEASSDAMVVTDSADDMVIAVNAEFSRVTGYTHEEAVGHPLAEFKWTDDDDKNAEMLRRLRDTGEVRNMEFAGRRKNGELVPSLISMRSVEFDGRQCRLTTARDITVLKDALRKAVESQATLGKIFEASSDSMIVTDIANNVVVAVNAEFTRATGYAREEIIGHAAADFKIANEDDETAEVLRLLQDTGEVRNMEILMRRKDGDLVPTLISIGNVEFDGRQCRLTASRNISALKEAQRKAVEGQATLGKIFEASSDAMIVTDIANNVVIAVNAEFTRATGYTREEAVGHPLDELRLLSDEKEATEILHQLRDTGEIRNMEVVGRCKNGELVPTLLSTGVLEFDGAQCRIMASRNIAALKQTERELVEAREAALDASRAKSEFLSSMSHEIRTPLNAVLGMAELLLETALDDEQRRFLDVMNANSIALLELINSILDLAKIESGRLQIENIEFELTEVVDKTIATFGIRAHSKGLELAARIAPGVPEHLTGDPHRLRQILVNLIGNALKFTEVGEVVLEIENDPEAARPGVLRFTVSDTGIGIPPDKLESIFSSFTQADSSTTRKYGGTGLGLSIAQRLTALMGGKIWIKSELDKGSSFIFTAPFGLASKVITATSNELPDLAGFRVLIVDDNPTNRLIARELVNSRGAEVTEAASGEEALEAVRTALEWGRPIQMVLLDMRMPGMDGLEVATRMRTELRASEPLILMLSSDDLMPQLSRMKEAGLDAYLVKPISRRELFDAITRVLAKAHSGRAVKPAERITSSAADSADLRASSILVAEDSPDNRLLIAAFLRRSPCVLQFAENGRLALELFKQNHYDLVLMDLQMPVMDGYASTRAIRDWEEAQHAPRTNIVALTASALSEDADRARAAGCDAHVTKPIKKATLLEVIREYSAGEADIVVK